MKKLLIILFGIFSFLFVTKDTYAIDSVYSINKNKDEKLFFIEKSYNEKHEIDGMISAGRYLKETIEEKNEKYEDYQVMLVKYNKSGKLLWKYDYGNTSKDTIYDLEYSYDQEGNIDGYILILKSTYDIITETDSNTVTIQKVGLDGKQVYEKKDFLNNNETITKIITTYDEENKVNGYLAIGSINNNTALLIKFDKEFNITYRKEQKNNDFETTLFIDVANVYENNVTVGYAVIRANKNKDNDQIELIRFDKDGNEVANIDNTLNKYNSTNLSETIDGVILYGKTENVKVKKGTMGYYVIKYNSQNNSQEWETVGETPLDEDGKIEITPKYKDDKINEYIVFLTNKENKTTQIVKMQLDGTIKNKVKKITNEYYDVEDFCIDKDILFFVGQIKCPDDDDCDYNTNSLFLISDEDKVIEVKDSQSTNIMLFTALFIAGCIIISFINKRRINKKR